MASDSEALTRSDIARFAVRRALLAGTFDALSVGLSVGHPAPVAPAGALGPWPETIGGQAIEWKIPVHT